MYFDAVDKNLVKQTVFQEALVLIDDYTLKEIETKLSETIAYYDPFIFQEVLYDIGLSYAVKKAKEEIPDEDIKKLLKTKGFQDNIIEKVLPQAKTYKKKKTAKIKTKNLVSNLVIAVISGTFMFYFKGKNEMGFIIALLIFWYGVGFLLYNSYKTLNQLRDKLN